MLHWVSWFEVFALTVVSSTSKQKAADGCRFSPSCTVMGPRRFKFHGAVIHRARVGVFFLKKSPFQNETLGFCASDFFPEKIASQRDLGGWKKKEKKTRRRKGFCWMPGEACFHGDVEACVHVNDDLTQVYPPLPRPPAARIQCSLFSPAAVTCRIHRRSFCVGNVSNSSRELQPPPRGRRVACRTSCVFSHGSLGRRGKPAL